MKKILVGVFLIALTVGLASGAAYALFSDKVEVKGVAISTGNADLQMDVGDGIYRNSVTMPSSLAWWTKNLYPGKEDWGSFVLKNNSSSEIGLKLSMRLTAATGWNDNNLKKVIEFYIADASAHALTNWYTLEEWNVDRPLNVTIAQGNDETLELHYRVRTTYKDSGLPVGNEIAGKSLTGVTFEITGTQN